MKVEQTLIVSKGTLSGAEATVQQGRRIVDYFFIPQDKKLRCDAFEIIFRCM